MDDEKIIELYFARDEAAIFETSEKYGSYCYKIASGIVGNHEDSEECVNDTWLRAWNSIPPHRPDILRLFLGKITRNTAIEKYRKNRAKKRGKGKIDAVLDELSEILSSCDGADFEDSVLLSDSISKFLAGLEVRDRTVFLRRYFFGESISEISYLMDLSKVNVSVILSRTRKKLKIFLMGEGYTLE